MWWERFEIDGTRWAYLPTRRRILNVVFLVAVSVLFAFPFSWVTGDRVTWQSVLATMIGLGIVGLIIFVWLPARATRRE